MALPPLALLLALGASSLALLGSSVRSQNAPSLPAFLVAALGSPEARAPLVRRPTAGVEATIGERGYTVERDGATLSVAADAAGKAPWRRFAGGASRPTPFGLETITIERGVTEEFLTVGRRQGLRTWRWRLAAPGLRPRLEADGSIGLFSGDQPVPLRLLPVSILDSAGRDVTPAGLRWSLERGG